MNFNGEDIPDKNLIERAVRNICLRRRNERRHVSRWVAISDTFGLGSTYSKLLCIAFGINPDTACGPEK